MSRVSRVMQKLTLESMGFMSRLSRVFDNGYLSLFVWSCIKRGLKQGKMAHPELKLYYKRQTVSNRDARIRFLMSWVSRVYPENNIKSIHYMLWVSRVIIFTSIYNVYSNSKSSNYSILRIKASNYTKLRIKPSNYNHFELNYM